MGVRLPSPAGTNLWRSYAVRIAALSVVSVLVAGLLGSVPDPTDRLGHVTQDALEAFLYCLVVGAFGYYFALAPERARWVRFERELREAHGAELSAKTDLERLISASPLGMALVDGEGHVRRANAKLAEIAGRPPEALAGQRLGELLPGFDLGVLPVREEDEAPSLRVEREIAVGGRTRSLVVDLLPFTSSAAGAGASILVRVEDVTERRVQKEELNEARRRWKTSEERFRAAFEQAAVGMSESSLDGHYRRVNRKLCELTGYTAEELCVRSFQDISHPDELPENLAQLGRMLRREILDFTMEKRYIRKDGTVFWANIAVSLLRGPAGEPEGLIGVIEDLTARRLAEQALEQERQNFRRILDEAPMLVWLSGPDGGCTFFNKTWLEFTGRTTDEEYGDGWAAGVHPDDLPGCLETYRAALATATPFRMEYRLRRHDGVFRWLLDTGVPLRGPDGTLLNFIGSCVDITPMREASERVGASNEKLRALSTRLVEVQEEERRLLARELHDGLGQSLTGLTYGLRWVAQRVGDSHGPVATRLDEMVREVESTILEVRDLSRRLRPASLDLGLVAALETEMAAFRRRTGLDCQLEAPPERIRLDSDGALALFRIAQEALTNVVRHAKASRVQVRVLQEDGQVRLEIADDGIGFDEATLGSREAFGLTGLRERVTPLGGRLAVELNEPRGTRVVAEIPAGPPSLVGRSRPA